MQAAETSVRVRLLYFAVVREIIGQSEETREIRNGQTLEQLFDEIIEDYPAISRLRPSLLFMVNEEYASPQHTIMDGDEIALIPPVSGGESPRFFVTEEPVSEAQVSALVASPDAGAIVTALVGGGLVGDRREPVGSGSTPPGPRAPRSRPAPR
jgi:molybdopterin synthase catalytic subunit